MMKLVARTLGWGLAGALIVPAAAFCAALLFVVLDPRCSSPGDSGGCYMGLATVTMAAVVPGFVGFAGVTLVRGLARQGMFRRMAHGLRRMLAPLRHNRR